MIRVIIEVILGLSVLNAVPALLKHFGANAWITVKTDLVLRKIGSTLLLLAMFDELNWSLIPAVLGVTVYWVCWHFRHYLKAVIFAAADTGKFAAKKNIAKNDKLSSAIKSYRAWEDKAVRPRLDNAAADTQLQNETTEQPEQPEQKPEQPEQTETNTEGKPAEAVVGAVGGMQDVDEQDL